MPLGLNEEQAMIERAEKRVFISSLYIGSKETKLVGTVGLGRHPI